MIESKPMNKYTQENKQSTKSQSYTKKIEIKAVTKSEYDEDLLMWSQALDFDEYSHSWNILATSQPSDAGTNIYNLATISTRRF